MLLKTEVVVLRFGVVVCVVGASSIAVVLFGLSCEICFVLFFLRVQVINCRDQQRVARCRGEKFSEQLKHCFHAFLQVAANIFVVVVETLLSFICDACCVLRACVLRA